MGSVNKVILVGNLGRDVELRYTPSGAAVANLSLATTRVWNDRSGQRQEETEWHRVVAWDKQADTANKFLRKGRQVYIEGRLQTRKWDDRDGNTRYTTEVRAERLVLLGRREDDADEGRPDRSDARAAPAMGGPASGPGREAGGPQPAERHDQGAPGPDAGVELNEDDIPF